MSLSQDELLRIQRLRGLFLADGQQEARRAEYWRDPEDLAAYDAVLGARIGWKWNAALDEAAQRGWGRSDSLTVLDYGCGSGVAARHYVRRFGAARVLCHDRSRLAVEFACQALQRHGVAAASCAEPAAADFDVLLVSHVLGELDAAGERELAHLATRSSRVFWVEPGNHAVARRLSALRERLREHLAILAPCPHADTCPALATADDWCHFFAAPPPEVFTDGVWVRIARQLGFDLRALPYAFLAAVRGGAATPAPAPGRVLGRPGLASRAASVHLCTAGGLRTLEITKRQQPALWRELKKDPTAVRWLPPE